MARIERFTATKAVPVEQAQLIDPNAFRLSTASAEALKSIGGALTQVAADKKREQEALDELARRKRSATDSLSTTMGVKARQLGDLEIRNIQENIGDPEERTKQVQAILDRVATEHGTRDLSPQAKQKENIEHAAWMAQTTKKVDIFEVSSQIDADIKVGGQTLIDLIGNDDGTPDSAVKIQNQIDSQRDALERDMTKEEATIALEELVKQGEELAVKKSIESIKEIAVTNPKATIEAMNEEIKKRKTGKSSPEFELLENTDLESIKDYANSIGEKQKTDSLKARESATVDAQNQIRDGETDLDTIIDQNNLTNQSADDKAKFANDVLTYFNKWNSTVVATETDANVYDELTSASEAVERGAMSPAEWENLYVEKKGELTTADQRSIRSGDIVATKSMQNRSFLDATTTARGLLIEATVDELTAFKLARDIALAEKEFEKVTQFNISLKKNQAEKWNNGRYRQALRQQIAQNPEWSQEQIFIAGEILLTQFDVLPEVLLQQFDKSEVGDGFLKTPPDDIFKDIWKDLPEEDRAKVWELRIGGTPSDVILSEITQ